MTRGLRASGVAKYLKYLKRDADRGAVFGFDCSYHLRPATARHPLRHRRLQFVVRTTGASVRSDGGGYGTSGRVVRRRCRPFDRIEDARHLSIGITDGKRKCCILSPDSGCWPLSPAP